MTQEPKKYYYLTQNPTPKTSKACYGGFGGSGLTHLQKILRTACKKQRGNNYDI